MFPYSILESREIRQELSESVNVLAELHSRTYLKVYARVKRSWDEHLKVRHQHESGALENKFIAQVTNLRQLLGNSKYQIQLGGRFPKVVYVSMINCVDGIFRSIMLVFYASRAFDELDVRASVAEWMTELRRVASPNEDIEIRTILTLSVCASAIDRGQPLPQFYDVLEPSSLLKAIEESPMKLLGYKYALEAGYSTLAAMHVSAMVVTEETKQLIRLSAELVGRVDLGYRIEAGMARSRDYGKIE